MRNSEYWIKWLKAAGIRAVRTFAQSLLASVSVAVLMSDVHWKEAISASLLASLISILMSVAGLPEVEE